MKEGDLIAKMKFPGFYYEDPEYFEKFLKSDLIKYGIIIYDSETNKGKFGNENLWFLVMWGGGEINWVSNVHLKVISENR